MHSCAIAFSILEADSLSILIHSRRFRNDEFLLGPGLTLSNLTLLCLAIQG